MAELSRDGVVIAASDDGSDDGAPLSAAGGGGGPAILAVNPALERLVGRSLSSLIGRPLAALLAADGDRSALDGLLADLAAGGPARAVIAVEGAAGPVWLEFAAHALPGADDAVQAIMLVAHDVGERLRAAEALRAAKQAAEEANLAKSRFLASASHDLRQPLNAMSLLLGVLRNRTDDPDLLPVCDQLQHSLDTMMELFNALLDISRLEASGGRVERTGLPVDHLLQRIAVDFAGQARAKGLDLRILPSRRAIWSDPVLIERILRNLVSNAIRYTPSGGRVLLGARRRDGALRLDVVDTGPGIPRDQLKTIFEEFHQLGARSYRPAEGHGLGLAIVRHAATLLGHRLEVASTPGRGSRFSIEVPVSPDPHAALGALAPPRRLGSAEPGCRVLVVEDDPMVGTAMRLVLEQLGCEVTLAAGGPQALAAARSAAHSPTRSPPAGPFTLILADYRLPGAADGIEVLQAVQALAGPAAVAGVITGDLEPSIAVRAHAIGARCLTKPVRPEELRALVRAAAAA